MTDLLLILLGVMMIAFALMSFGRGRRSGLWRVRGREARLKEVRGVFAAGGTEVAIDLDEAELSYEDVTRAAWEGGYVPAGRDRTRIQDVARYSFFGDGAPMPGVLADSPHHAAWRETPEGRVRGSGAQSLAVVVGLAGAVVLVLALLV